MLVAQISDTHILTPDADHPAARTRSENLADCVADINRQSVDLVVLTGDTVQNGHPEEYALLSELLAPIDAPLYIVPGNRDDKRALGRCARAEPLQENETFMQYSIDVGSIRLVGLDSTLVGERKGVFCVDRQAWLEKTLASAKDRDTVLIIHHPPFDVGDHYVNGYRHSEDATALAEIVSRHHQVIGLLCGHVHWPIEQIWAGTEARIMPSVAVDVRKGIDEKAAMGRPVYCLHQIDSGGRLTTAMRQADQSVARAR